MDTEDLEVIDLGSDEYCHNFTNGDISWGHSHSICDRKCSCWPECKPERKKSRKEILDAAR